MDSHVGAATYSWSVRGPYVRGGRHAFTRPSKRWAGLCDRGNRGGSGRLVAVERSGVTERISDGGRSRYSSRTPTVQRVRRQGLETRGLRVRFDPDTRRYPVSEHAVTSTSALICGSPGDVPYLPLSWRPSNHRATTPTTIAAARAAHDTVPKNCRHDTFLSDSDSPSSY